MDFTRLNTLPLYHGVIPNRPEMTERDRALAIFEFITFNVNAYPPLNEFINNMNSISEEMNSFISQSDTIFTNYLNTTKEYRNKTEQFKDIVLSQVSSDLALNGWNDTDDFTDKRVIYKNIEYLSITNPNINSEPTPFNTDWQVLKYHQRSVKVFDDYVADYNDIIYADTTNKEISITLPTGIEGIYIEVIDLKMNFDINICKIVVQNSDKILFNKDDEIIEDTYLDLTIKNLSIKLIFIDNYWRIK